MTRVRRRGIQHVKRATGGGVTQVKVGDEEDGKAPEVTSIRGNCLTFCCNITFGFGGTNDYFRQPCRGPFKRVYKNGLINLHHINKALTHTTRHTLTTIWLIADNLGREGPGLVWFHAACSCEAAKFSKMPSETDCCREMTIQLRGNSSGGCSCCQHADCTLPPCRTRGIVLCLVAWAA